MAMRVVVGPVAAESARAWLGYAREVLTEFDELLPAYPCDSGEVVAIFERYLDQWDEVAYVAGDDPFQWSDDLAPEIVEYHVHAFNQIATALAERAARRGGRMSPVAGDEFYTSLVNGIVAGLADGPESSAEFAQHLGAFWPFPASV